MPKYPDIEVELVGQNGNVFVLMGLVTRALRRANVPAEEIKAFQDKVTSGDHDHALRTLMEWVTVT